MTIFLWQTPIPIQLPVDLTILKVTDLDSIPAPTYSIGLSKIQDLYAVG